MCTHLRRYVADVLYQAYSAVLSFVVVVQMTVEYWSAAGACFDTDKGAQNTAGNGCSVYTVFPPYCSSGAWNDVDFNAEEMCCACGGGAPGIRIIDHPCFADLDPATATEMFCNSSGLDGTLPAELGEFTKLKILNVRGNKLNGSVPSEIGLLGELVSLDLAENDFESLPPEIGQLWSLVEMRIAVEGARGGCHAFCFARLAALGGHAMTLLLDEAFIHYWPCTNRALVLRAEPGAIG